jgi:glycosyltransferase involved in cell wall biosynthesis
VRQRPLRLGILSAEFFEPTLSRGRGGFGKNVRTVASYFRTHSELGVEVFLIHGFRRSPPGAVWTSLDGIPLLMRPAGASRWSDWITYRRLLAQLRLDVVLTMNFSPPFRGALLALPRTPAIVWARDPRPPEDWAEIATLRIPGARGRPSDSRPVDATCFRSLYALARWTRRPLRIAVPAEFIARKVGPTYGVVPPTVYSLPVFLDVPDVPRVKARWPRVIFLGRLDPIKRPWVYWELARALPDVEFLCLGESYYPYEQDGGWTPSDPPPNLRVLGHLDDPARAELLASSWLLVNTSIHEALPTSFLEALFCETPIVSCQEAGGLVSRFGRYVGRFDGDGLAAVPHLADAVQRLLEDPALRTDLGYEGREWVIRHYNASRFLAAFSDLLSGMGLRWRPPIGDSQIPVTGAKNPS